MSRMSILTYPLRWCMIKLIKKDGAMDLKAIERSQKLLSELVEKTQDQSEIIANITELLNEYIDYLRSEIERL